MKGYEPLALIALGFAAAKGINIVGAAVIGLVAWAALAFIWQAVSGKEDK